MAFPSVSTPQASNDSPNKIATNTGGAWVAMTLHSLSGYLLMLHEPRTTWCANKPLDAFGVRPVAVGKHARFVPY